MALPPDDEPHPYRIARITAGLAVIAIVGFMVTTRDVDNLQLLLMLGSALAFLGVAGWRDFVNRP